MLNKFIGFHRGIGEILKTFRFEKYHLTPMVMCFLFISGGTRVDTPVFSATSYDSGSSPEIPPTLIFTEWQVGRGVRGYSREMPVHLTFITTSETECRVFAAVGYNSNQPSNTSPINPATVQWDFSQLSHGMTLAEPPGTSWSGSHPTKRSGYTRFNFLAILNVPRHTRSTRPEICNDANNYRRHLRVPLHRNNTPMAMTIRFRARTYGNHAIELSLPLVQDEIDRMRQEYLDLS